MIFAEALYLSPFSDQMKKHPKETENLLRVFLVSVLKKPVLLFQNPAPSGFCLLKIHNDRIVLIDT